MKLANSLAEKIAIKLIKKKYGVDLGIIIHDMDIEMTENRTRLCINAEFSLRNEHLEKLVNEHLK